MIKANNQELFAYSILFSVIYNILTYTIFDMTSLSIILPDTIAEDSSKVAKKLGVSRTEFIRRAIIHELDSFKKSYEEEGMIRSFNAMKQSAKYSKESNEIIEHLFTELPEEEDKWWEK